MATRSFATAFNIDRVDREGGVIKGVSVITEGIANGEIVDAESLRQIKACCETYANGLKVVDRHTTGRDSIFATVGVLKNFRVEGKKLLADLYTLKSETNTAKLMDMAETIPDTFGLSVAFSGPEEVVNGQSYSRCTEIYNAALVDVPAANPTGLFSKERAEVQTHFVDALKSAKLMGAENTNPDSTGATTTAAPDLSSRIKKLEDTVVAMEKKMLPADPDATACMSKLQESVKQLSEKLDGAVKDLTARVGDRKELAQTFAKEFTANIGTAAIVKANPTDTAAQNNTEAAKGTVAKFVELAKKHFVATKSKVQAIRLAMDEDPQGYAAFRTSGQNIKYS